MQERPSPPRTCRTTPKYSQIVLYGGVCARGKAEAKGKKCKAAEKVYEAPPPEDVEEKEDLLIRDIWTQETDIIHDMCFVITETVSYHSKTPEKCLETAEQKKKKKKR